MSYLTLILKNPFRNKTRTSLSIIGIAIGIMIIVAMGMITNGLQSSTQTTLKAGAAEITVTHSGSNTFGSSGGTIDQSRVSDIKGINGVKDAAGILRTSSAISSSTSGSTSTSSSESGGFGSLSIFLIGIDSNQLSLAGISTDNTNGSLFSNGSGDEVIIGKTAAQNLNKTVGDTINLHGTNFKITGIFETGNFLQDGGIFMESCAQFEMANLELADPYSIEFYFGSVSPGGYA